MEVITEDVPRVKFNATWNGTIDLALRDGADPPMPSTVLEALSHLGRLQARLEAIGVIPILNDGLVGGNCAVRTSQGILVSRSGKPPGLELSPTDYVLVERFDRNSWTAVYRSRTPDMRPSSDTPLHWAALMSEESAVDKYGWNGRRPCVVLHAHALAQGPGLDAAQRAGLPISKDETLFSTPEDLKALEELFSRFSYPNHRRVGARQTFIGCWLLVGALSLCMVCKHDWFTEPNVECI
jgi:hypothetical protein